MSALRGVIHVHTRHSFDSLLPVRAYLAAARRARLNFLAITDHNTLDGAREAARLCRDDRLQIIIGAEYATDLGDVIGLFLTEPVRSRRFHDVVAEIRGQGGLALLPHPNRGRVVGDELFGAVDLIEVFNARSSETSNGRTLADAARWNTPRYVAPDIHTAGELIRNRTTVTIEGTGDLRELLLTAPRTFTTRSTARRVRRYSQIVKRIRRHAGFPGHA